MGWRQKEGFLKNEDGWMSSAKKEKIEQCTSDIFCGLFREKHDVVSHI